jgi:hypothetical protein
MIKLSLLQVPARRDAIHGKLAAKRVGIRGFKQIRGFWPNSTKGSPDGVTSARSEKGSPIGCLSH